MGAIMLKEKTHLQSVWNITLNPIVNLDATIEGYELLPKVSNINCIGIDDFIFLIERQLEVCQKWGIQHPEIYKNKALHIHVKRNLLSSNDFKHLLIPILNVFRIYFVIDDN